MSCFMVLELACVNNKVANFVFTFYTFKTIWNAMDFIGFCVFIGIANAFCFYAFSLFGIGHYFVAASNKTTFFKIIQ